MGDDYLIYFDVYREKNIWRYAYEGFPKLDVTEEVKSIPVGHKHGTIFTASESVVKNIAGRKEINPETILNQNK